MQSLLFRKYTLYLIVVFFLLLMLSFALVLVSDFNRFEKQSITTFEKLQTQFNYYIKQNEAVLEGFSAFVSGLGDINDKKLITYAQQMKIRFPHLYMLEVAEGVTHDELSTLEKRQQEKGFTDFKVKAFDYSGNRSWKPVLSLDYHYPLVFLYPLPEKSRDVLGLDLSSHKHLAQPLKQAFLTGKYQTSLPFKLVEGDDAFIMFKAVSGDIDNKKQSKYITLILMATDNFKLDLTLPDSPYDLLVYHNSRSPTDPSGHFISTPVKINNYLPVLKYDTSIKEGDSGLILQYKNQIQLKDITWGLLLAILIILIVSFYLIRRTLIQNELLLEKNQNILRQKHKMIAISNLTGGIAHEFNNKLGASLGYLNFLTDKCSEDDEARVWLSNAVSGTEQCIDLTRKLLTYTRYQGLRERVGGIDICNIVKSYKDALLQMINTNIKLEVIAPEESVFSLIDENDFKEVIYNLVKNANDAILQDGIITIAVTAVCLNGFEFFETDVDVVAGNYIHLQITDTGTGIDKDIAGHVFDPFFTTKRIGEGSGLGLSIVYGLVKLNNGYLNFISENNEGTIFNIYLPQLLVKEE